MMKLGNTRHVHSQARKPARRSRSAQRTGLPVGIGAAAGIVTAAGMLLGRRAIATVRTGQGHSLKHRVLDLAAGTIQPKYPLDAMST